MREKGTVVNFPLARERDEPTADRRAKSDELDMIRSQPFDLIVDER